MSSNPQSLRRPPALRPGDRVAVLSVSSPAPPDRLALGIECLRFAGLEPVVYESARDQGTFRGFLAGDDALRAADLTSALGDRDIAGVWIARGGVGAQRTVAAVEWAALRELPPKVVAGYSDVTALLEALAVELGWASVHSTMVVDGYPGTAYSSASALRTLMAPERAMALTFADATTVVPGHVRGVTLGGNLTVLTASVGTPSSRPAAGGVLLVEEECEEPYRIDRMLTQLLRSGYLDGVTAIVTGFFHDCGPQEDVSAILTERLGALGVPMISWANVGHGGAQQAFPIGVAAELDADARTLQFLEPPLVPAGG